MRQKAPKVSTAKSKEVSGKDKHDKWFQKSLTIQVTENPKEQIVKQKQKYKSISEGIQKEYVHHEGEKKSPEEDIFPSITQEDYPCAKDIEERTK